MGPPSVKCLLSREVLLGGDIYDSQICSRLARRQWGVVNHHTTDYTAARGPYSHKVISESEIINRITMDKQKAQLVNYIGHKRRRLKVDCLPFADGLELLANSIEVQR